MGWGRHGLPLGRLNRKHYIQNRVNYELISVGLGAASGIIATYIKMQNELVKIKSRVISLEKQEGRVQKLLLAKKGIE